MIQTGVGQQLAISLGIPEGSSRANIRASSIGGRGSPSSNWHQDCINANAAKRPTLNQRMMVRVEAISDH